MPKTSASQCEMLVDYMERNGDLSKPTTGPNGRLNSLKQWQNLTDLLNADATGDTKSTEKWRKEIIPVGPSPSPQAVDRSESSRYVIYLLTIKSIPHLCRLILKYQNGGRVNLRTEAAENKDYLLTIFSCAAILVHFEESLFKADFVYIGTAYLIVKYPEMASKPSISYGVGMACSFFEGYLVHIIPSDGAKFVGFEENIRILEAREGVLFPVKKLFIIITKNMFCPPDLKEFNKGEDLPRLEAFNQLGDIVKSVAGVRNRTYRNTAYKVYRARAAPVCLAAECATPLHTLHRVLANRALYQEVADINVPEVVEDFCSTLRSIIAKSPECRGKCELIFYDNEDPNQNLAQILIDRIRELAPDFEERIIARKNQNVVEED